MLPFPNFSRLTISFGIDTLCQKWIRNHNKKNPQVALNLAKGILAAYEIVGTLFRNMAIIFCTHICTDSITKMIYECVT